jgi:hypothetical protein
LRQLIPTDVSITAVKDAGVDACNRATIRLWAGEQGVLVVLAVADHTDERTQYRLTDVWNANALDNSTDVTMRNDSD